MRFPLRAAVPLAALGLALSMVPGLTRAEMLTPTSVDNNGNAFVDQGTLNVTTFGAFDTGNGVATPTLTVNATVFNGEVYTYSNGNKAAVFEFDQIAVSGGGTLSGNSDLPVVLLSKGDVVISGSGSITLQSDLAGPEAGGDGGFPGGAGGGGGFGGIGGMGSNLPGYTNGGIGGGTYGDLHHSLQGGSRGGAGDYNGGFPGFGGFGGGGLEIASVTAINIGGDGVHVDGQQGGEGNFSPFGLSGLGGSGGGGSGGGLLLIAPSVNLTAPLTADGGYGGNVVYSYDDIGGGGGGGRILIQTAPGGLIGRSLATASGTGGTGNSAPGVVTFETSAVPEPASIGLLGLGLAGVLVYAGRRRARRAGRRRITTIASH